MARSSPGSRVGRVDGSAVLLATDPATRRVFDLAERAARSQANVLIVGESGTGKSLLARRIHELGPRRSGPFVEIPLANLPEELIESELFGHEKGAFTGAVAPRAGRFEEADGGTVLIEGVIELSPALQAKLLRVLQERTVERLGGNRTLELDVRFLASAPPGIEERVADGSFRQDLYYRLNVLRLEVPPLRSRGRDITALARTFLSELRARGGPSRFSPDVVAFFRSYPWPGNVRELRNSIEAALIACTGEEIRLDHLPPSSLRNPEAMLGHAAGAGLSLAALEEAYIREVLRRTGGNFSEAARILGIHRKTLLEKRRRYGIDG